MKKDNIKQVFISILVGATVAFLTTLFEGLAEFFKSHSTDMIAGGATAMTYIAKAYKG